MADVRLTIVAEDGQVYPVLGTPQGTLVLQDPEVVEGPQGPPGPKGEDGQDGKDGKDGDPFSGNFADDVTFGGSAEFSGNKAGFTSEGYLWCTTVRGDTVMLDATSNGMGVWVDYTPTTRIDEIRDKLDANRGDTGEMPADTP